MRTISVRGKVVDSSRGYGWRGRFSLAGVGLLAAVLLVGLERLGRAQQPAVSEAGKPSIQLPEVAVDGSGASSRETVEGNMPGTPRPESVSTQYQRIAELG